MRAETTLQFLDGEWMGIRVCVMLERWWDVRTDRAVKGGREGGRPGNRLMGRVFHEPNENSKVTTCLSLMCSCSTNVALSSKRMMFSTLLNNVATTT
jgi:hypothetical protein